MDSAPPGRMPAPQDAFDAAMAFVLAQEGGFVDHPADPGGPTKYGISLRYVRSRGRLFDLDKDGDVDLQDILLLTPQRAAELYRTDFWAPLRAGDLPAPLALVAFDSAINCGGPNAARWLQRALGMPVLDGIVGPQTLARAAKADVAATAQMMIALRAAFYRSLPGFPTFGRGWMRRLSALAAVAAHLEDTRR